MCKITTHSTWARRVIDQSKVFGVHRASTIEDLENFEAETMSNVTNLISARIKQAEKLLSADDLYILQNDILSRPLQSQIPSSMKDDFFDWLRDCYSPVERESLMSPENMEATEIKFLEEAVDGEDTELAARAAFVLNKGQLTVVDAEDNAGPGCTP